MPPEKCAYALARYSRSPDSIRESIDWVRSHDSQKFLESFYFQYGHASIADLGWPVQIPHEVPWFPKDVDAWSLRWVLLHLIEETARHAGHADIIREAIDGATAFPLMAAVESWPANPWIKPWAAKSLETTSRT